MVTTDSIILSARLVAGGPYLSLFSTSALRRFRLKFFGVHARLDNIRAFKAYLAPLRKIEWVVYAKRPFGGPRAVLDYLSRYTHRVAISNRRLLAAIRHPSPGAVDPASRRRRRRYADAPA